MGGHGCLSKHNKRTFCDLFLYICISDFASIPRWTLQSAKHCATRFSVSQRICFCNLKKMCNSFYDYKNKVHLAKCLFPHIRFSPPAVISESMSDAAISLRTTFRPVRPRSSNVHCKHLLYLSRWLSSDFADFHIHDVMLGAGWLNTGSHIWKSWYKMSTAYCWVFRHIQKQIILNFLLPTEFIIAAVYNIPRSFFTHHFMVVTRELTDLQTGPRFRFNHRHTPAAHALHN